MYFIRIASTNIVKVGYTGNIMQRLCTLQTACPGQLEVQFQFQTVDAKRVETLLHSELEEKKIRGEWFFLEPNFDFVSLIKKVL